MSKSKNEIKVFEVKIAERLLEELPELKMLKMKLVEGFKKAKPFKFEMSDTPSLRGFIVRLDNLSVEKDTFDNLYQKWYDLSYKSGSYSPDYFRENFCVKVKFSAFGKVYIRYMMLTSVINEFDESGEIVEAVSTIFSISGITLRPTK
jgi:hypothetical protein